MAWGEGVRVTKWVDMRTLALIELRSSIGDEFCCRSKLQRGACKCGKADAQAKGRHQGLERCWCDLHNSTTLEQRPWPNYLWTFCCFLSAYGWVLCYASLLACICPIQPTVHSVTHVATATRKHRRLCIHLRRSGGHLGTCR